MASCYGKLLVNSFGPAENFVPFGYDQTQAWTEVRKLRRAWRTVTPDWIVMERASTLLGRYSLSFWDAMIIAACLDGGVSTLYSEDFDSYPNIEGLSLINPFKVP